MRLLRTFLHLSGCLAMLGGAPALALDPARSIGQYKHSSWTIDNDVPRSILALAQGRSGYLWIGSTRGLFRFDGIRFEGIPLPQQHSENPQISALRVSQQGDVWIGFGTGGTAVYRDGAVHDVPMAEPAYVMTLVETPDHAIWAALGRKFHQLMRFADGRWSEVGTSLGFPTEDVIAMIAARDGAIWVTTTKSVLVLPNGSARFRRLDVPPNGHGALSEDAQGKIWLSDQAGTRAIGQRGGVELPAGRGRYETPFAKRNAMSMFDRDGNLWGITDAGIFRLRTPTVAATRPPLSRGPAAELFRQKDGLTSDTPTVIFEDREGNIWVGTVLGLDRFRPARVVTEPVLRNRAFWGDVLLSAADGTVYVGEADAIYRIRPARNPELLLRAHEPQAMCEGRDGSVWIVLQRRVLRLRKGKIDSIPGPRNNEEGISDCALDDQGRIWLAALRDGMFQRVGGSWRQTMVPPALGGFPPATLLRTRRQGVLVGFDESLVAAIDPQGTPRFLVAPDTRLHARTLFEAPDGLLIGGRSGITRIAKDGVRLIPSRRFPELSSITGIVQTNSGETWMSSAAGLVGVSTAALDRAFVDPRQAMSRMVLDFRDGLGGVQSRDAIRSLAKGGDGRIWFSNGAGTAWIDPSHFWRNRAVPPVEIAALKSRGAFHRDPHDLALPAGSSNVEIAFAAPSLAIPERVRVLYRLEGADSGWVDPGMRRQAFYTNLAPGHYVFRVIAANDDGVWNRTGAKLEFDIAPTFLQSRSFLAMCVLGAFLVLWCLYSLRVRQLAGRMRDRLEERVAERERIARDLHDTLLQGFQGLILRFQSVANQIPADEPARRLIDDTLDSADDILNAGRDSVHQLRAGGASELSQAFVATAERLRENFPAQFNMVVEGSARTLHPVVREELSRIGEEALINAFQHADAQTIEMVLSYRPSSMSLGVRDDGVGIDPEIFAGGRQGHFGLVGMRERARQIDAAITITSRPGAGTEIVVTVPGRIAYSLKPRFVARVLELVAGPV
ncbi:MAG: two-component regulator propeller domain-containing protein [Sphingomicrobium sp.]